MRKVNIYIYSDITGGMRKQGYYAYVLECMTEKGPVTRWSIQKVENCTGNKAQMEAVIEAMGRIKEPCEITLYTDTTYLQSGLEHEWISKWEENGWKRADGHEIANKEEWQQLKELFQNHHYSFVTNEKHAYWNWMRTQVNQKKELMGEVEE